MSPCFQRCVFVALTCLPFTALAADIVPWPANLPIYDHIVVVIEENKNYDQIIGNEIAPYINKLAADGALFSQSFGEEHNSQGNYFWVFSGSNQEVGFTDEIPDAKNNPHYPFETSNLGAQLIAKGRSFKGYSENLPAIGSDVATVPANCDYKSCIYARKHVPWISFKETPGGTAVDTSWNLRFADFPSDYTKLPTVAFVIPDLTHDMHNGNLNESVPAGDAWLKQNLGRYYGWAMTHNSLLIVTFDENDDKSRIKGLTDPRASPDNEALLALQNRIVTVFAGAHIKPGVYPEGTGITHVNILRTIEAMYGLPKSGRQQPNAAAGGIGDDTVITDIFDATR